MKSFHQQFVQLCVGVTVRFSVTEGREMRLII
jgi:hypothetical protein